MTVVALKGRSAAVAGAGKASVIAPPNPLHHEFDYALNETVSVMLTGRVIERKETSAGDQYWIEQELPDGRTARQWFKARDVFPGEGA